MNGSLKHTPKYDGLQILPVFPPAPKDRKLPPEPGKQDNGACRRRNEYVNIDGTRALELFQAMHASKSLSKDS